MDPIVLLLQPLAAVKGVVAEGGGWGVVGGAGVGVGGGEGGADGEAAEAEGGGKVADSYSSRSA